MVYCTQFVKSAQNKSDFLNQHRVGRTMKQFSAEEVAKHNKAGDCWIIIESKVFDVSKFLSEHPGGSKVVLKVAGLLL